MGSVGRVAGRGEASTTGGWAGDATGRMALPDRATARSRRHWPGTGRFDYYVDSCFRPDSQGRSIFRPHGLMGSGYVMDTAEREQRLRRFIRAYLICTCLFSFPVVIVLLGVASYPAFLVLLVLDIGAYEIGVRRIVAGLPRSSEGRSSFRERLEEQAVATGRGQLAVLEAISLVFVLMGVFLIVALPEIWWIGSLNVAFFGVGAAMFAWELRALQRRPRADRRVRRWPGKRHHLAGGRRAGEGVGADASMRPSPRSMSER